jgi:hypothetical protein
VIVSEVTETMKDGARRRGTVARDSGKWFVAKDVCQSCCGRCELMPLSEPRFRDEHGSLVHTQRLRGLGGGVVHGNPLCGGRRRVGQAGNGRLAPFSASVKAVFGCCVALALPGAQFF